MEEIQSTHGDIGDRGDQQWTSRTQGDDITNIAPHAPPMTSKTNSMALEVTDNLRQKYQATIRAFDLNTQQYEAAMHSLGSQSGVTTIHGPPGCGKTRTVMAIAAGHITIGRELGGRRRRIIASASSNIGVGVMLETFCRTVDAAHNFEVVRYMGNLSDTGEKMPQQTAFEPTENDISASDDEDLDFELAGRDFPAANGELAGEKNTFSNESHEDFAFHAKRLARFQAWAALDDHAKSEQARRYLEIQEALRNFAVSKSEARNLHLEGEDLDIALTQYYLQNDVDIVFCTHSSAACGSLRDFFRPTILISDGHAAAGVPNMGIPMGTFIDNLEHIVISSSQMQQQPVVQSTSTDENYQTLQASVSNYLSRGRVVKDSLVKLNVQYRMHPDLSESISRLYYRTAPLENHPSLLLRSDRKWLTLESMLKGLQAAYNGRRRVVIDVSGGDVNSEYFNETTSSFNASEADVAVEIVKYACLQQPPVGGEAITPSDFLLLSPYAGQCQYINDLLFKDGVNRTGDSARVSSTGAIQGEEARFVILSLTRNVPGKILGVKFAAHGNSLHVAMSRAKEALIILGNVRSWVKAYNDGAKMLRKGGKMSGFGMLLADLQDKGDIVSRGDFFRWGAGQEIRKSGFLMILETDYAVRERALSSGREGGSGRRGGRGGRGRGGRGGRGRGSMAGPSASHEAHVSGADLDDAFSRSELAQQAQTIQNWRARQPRWQQLLPASSSSSP